MKKNVIVSLADSNYFELLNELVDSIKSFEKSKDTAICIVDAGLSETQKKILAISTFLYLCLIPISYFHYKKIKNEKNIITDKNESEDLEDIL
jgi:hypothetical protein